jgi:site-specific DNA-cytosine methylase
MQTKIDLISLATLQLAWLVTKRVNGSCVSLDDLQSEFCKSRAVYPKLNTAIKLATELGWVEPSGKKFSATARGTAVSTSTSWRLISPTEEEKSVLQRYKIENAFLNKKTYQTRPKVIDLFGGVGGLSLAFESAGFHVAASIDNDPQACEAHKKNFPSSAVIKVDINDFAKSPQKFLAEAGITDSIFGVVGGPPCQGFSTIGERVVDDDRNFLTTRFTDIVLKTNPHFFVMENVAGLKTIGMRPNFYTYITDLAKPIGTCATSLALALPKIEKDIAKRERQFKKRLISDSIRKYLCALNENLDKVKNDVPRNFEALFFEFFDSAASQFITAFDAAIIEANIALKRDKTWMNLATEGLKENTPAIQKILIGIMVSAQFRKDSIGAEKFLRGAFSRTNRRGLKVLLEEIFHNYDAQPQGQSYNGETIGPILARIIKRVEGKYTIYGPKLLRAYQFGAPQNRQRLFLVGVRKDYVGRFEFPAATHTLPSEEKFLLDHLPAPTCDQAIGDLPDVDRFSDLLRSDGLCISQLSESCSVFARTMRYEVLEVNDFNIPRPCWNPLVVDCCTRTVHSAQVLLRLQETQEGIQDKKSGKTRLRRDSVAHTLRAGTREEKGSHTAVRPVHYHHNRVITVREGARLMGFPDWMTFHPTKWHGFRLVGNAVPFDLGAAVARELMRLFKKAHPFSR